MEAYGRLVKDIENIDQLGAYLGGKPYSLAFTSAEGRCRTVERQIPQPDFFQESDPVGELLQDVAGYEHLRG